MAVYTNDGLFKNRMEHDGAIGNVCVPSHGPGRGYVRLGAGRGAKVQAEVWSASGEMVEVVRDLDEMNLGKRGGGAPADVSRHLFHVPEAGVLITLARERDRLILRQTRRLVRGEPVD